MPIQSPSTGPAQSNPAQNNDVNQAQEAAQTNEAATDEAAETEDGPGPTDRLDISDAARAAQEEIGGEDAALIERGRQALEASSLSEDRLADLQERVADGQFTQPEVVQQVAAEIANDFA